MKKLLIISFDLVKEQECQSFAIGSIISSLKSDKSYGQTFDFEWYTYNLLTIEKIEIEYFLNSSLFEMNLSQFTHIAISCYVWCNSFINPLIDKIFEYNFRGKIILGGYEISYSNNEEIKKMYPKANYFIKGYAESALLEILSNTSIPNKSVLSKNIDFSLLPSPYLTQTLKLHPNIPKIRWETKRGCPFKCNFCAHRDLIGVKVNYHYKDKIFNELALFKEYNIKKINVLDPVFNMGIDYLDVLNEAYRIGLNSELSLQVRPELVTDKFLNIAEKLNVCLEFGIQTLNEKENQVIKRGNKIEKIFETLKKVNQRKIKYEVSLIYGLPYQTISSFSQTIDNLRENGCKSITAFPLMLLKGTELYDLKKEFKFKEKTLGKYNIPVVIESNSFTEKEWWQMHDIATQLNPNQRVS